MFEFLAILLVIAQFVVPTRWAFVPLLIGVCNLPNMPILDVGVTFTPAKQILLAGLIRAAFDKNVRWTPVKSLDPVVYIWAVWAVLSTLGHNPPDHNPFTVRLALAFQILGGYVYARAYIRSQDDWLRFLKSLALICVPFAFAMLFEKVTGRSFTFTITGEGEMVAALREGRLRASGPFSHPILAGTNGATTALLIFALFCYRDTRKLAWVGFAACTTIVFCSASSSPILALAAGAFVISLWGWRTHVRRIWYGFVACVIALHIAMKAPVWYLLQRIDLVGGSTGNHRAELITQAFEHISDWWFVGTDYTRHWFPYGVDWSANNADITNYYIKMGIIGGIPLMFFFITILARAFGVLGREMKLLRWSTEPHEFVVWCVASALFAHCVSFFSISYYDQSDVVLFLTIGAVPGLCRTSAKPVASSAKSRGGRRYERKRARLESEFVPER